MFVISCHADTCQAAHRCLDEGATVYGHLDNFAGVYAVMQAYFSGQLTEKPVRIALTYGEEVDFAGAYEVLDTLAPTDMVIVVDVTGYPTSTDFTIEKCRNPRLLAWLKDTLHDFSFEAFADCPDPVASEDEVDVYSQRLEDVCFLGIPCLDGDYNEEMTRCRKRSLTEVARALVTLAQHYPEYAPR